MTTVISGLVPILVYGALTPGIVWRARRNHLDPGTLLAQLLLGAWIAAIVALTLFPLPIPAGSVRPVLHADAYDWPAPWASITPFATIGMSLERGFGSAEGRVLIGNVLAFVPLGFLAPVLDDRWRSVLRILALGIVVSAAIELGQLAWDLLIGMPWRSADIDDVIVNAFGTVVGYVAWRLAGAAMAGRRARVSAA
jgi:glycopeptide antibiotics resistance protein